MAGIDEDQREVGVRRRGDHVAGVLLVAGRVRQHEDTAIGAKIAVGDVDGDALLAFRLEAVEQQRIVELAAGRAEPAGQAGERLHLVGGDRAGLREQPADEGGLAVVDRPAGDHAQQIAIRHRRREHRIRHQK